MLNINKVTNESTESQSDRDQRNLDKGIAAWVMAKDDKRFFFMSQDMLEALLEIAKKQKLESIGFSLNERKTKAGQREVVYYFEPKSK